jgi:hypothetical protein
MAVCESLWRRLPDNLLPLESSLKVELYHSLYLEIGSAEHLARKTREQRQQFTWCCGHAGGCSCAGFGGRATQ